MSADRDIDGWLAERGLTLADSRTRARAALEEGGLTRAGKARMSEEKLARASALLDGRFFPHCGAPACLAAAQGSGREPLHVTPRSHCAHCGGSDNRRAERAFLEACRGAGVQRVVIVGGSPAVREELGTIAGAEVALRLVDGTERRTADRARGDLEWADLVLVWGATELHHQVSTHYTAAPPPLRRKVLHVPKRGVAALLAAAITHLQR
ncbi:hypothetical protein FGE12_03825 [Aggregicoccus sp. 17bor-14]|uniref:hypothetical protein n=1 Tax=Myxococcaceae TaxID=31 RepID=UPI0012F1D450|nr:MULTISPECIES: hypothetical protein [Myxococcaceae]MBF5041503.1 hypothetical protein [Simulacricoccus sp. 17bor-14]MRI87287.1 hypothetical protein [Aggregicoccus sp. 17bor-14]